MLKFSGLPCLSSGHLLKKMSSQQKVTDSHLRPQKEIVQALYPIKEKNSDSVPSSYTTTQ
jgi:hypothetical protein